MTPPDEKTTLHNYLQRGREALLWKLDGVSEYDARRPLVPTGSNLLGLLKHNAGVEAGYFGSTFDRPFPEEPFYWEADDAEPNADMWAAADESRADIVDLYRRVQEHSDATIAALDLDAPGRVPWWSGERAAVTLHQILVHVVAETQRHAGHADLLRELIDGEAGLSPHNANFPDVDVDWWPTYRERLEATARLFAVDAPEG